MAHLIQLLTVVMHVEHTTLHTVQIEFIGICVPLHDGTHDPLSIYRALFIQVMQ